MRFLGLVLVLLAGSRLPAGEMPAPATSNPASQTQPAGRMPGLGGIHHPVLTRNVEAQQWFNQGLELVYAFNHEEAIRSFEQATRLDPNMAMAYWGISLALGPNINLDVDPAREKAACDAVQQAVKLASGRAPQEQAYIQALARRYSDDPSADLEALSVDYSRAMRDLSKRYPDDLDAATLYAESVMDLHPWALWRPDGEPEEGTLEAVAALESVLRRDPNHTGANHYYIHAVEASPSPQRAYASAKRLETLALAAGHLVHMPAHIYIRMGDYQAAAASNEQAVVADQAYMRQHDVHGAYPMMYYSHNLHFLAVCCAMFGRFEEAYKTARMLAEHVSPHVRQIPMLDPFLSTQAMILVRFGRWEEILKIPVPDRNLPLSTGLWHFARGMAYASTREPAKAQAEYNALRATREAIPPHTSYPPGNKPADVLLVAERVLEARNALDPADHAAAAAALRKAVQAEDALRYMEPPDWYLPTRELLGGVLLADKPAEAEEAFREDLEKHPRSGRSLFGLMLAVRAQHKIYDAQLVQEQFMHAWENADTMLREEDLWDIRPPLVPPRGPAGAKKQDSNTRCKMPLQGYPASAWLARPVR